MPLKRFMQSNSDNIIFFQIWDETGKIIAASGNLEKLPIKFIQSETDNYQDSGFRNIYRITELGALRLVVKSNNELFQGSKMVQRICAIYFGLIPYLKQVEGKQRQHFDSIIKRFSHNLIKFQLRFKGNFDRLISDSARSRPFSEFKEEVQRRIEANISMAATDVCQMSHRAIDLDAQIDTLRVISGYADIAMKEKKIKANLQKTIFRLANPFVEEFRKRGIEFEIDIKPSKAGENKVSIAPNLFNAAIWQLLDNASKYALDNNNITITSDLENKPPQLNISMISVCIDLDEENLVFLEGRTGRNAGNKAENGIGLFIVKKALVLMGANISVKNLGFICEDKGFKYCKHSFTITFSTLP